MDKRTVTLENHHYRNVLNVIETLLYQIPSPAGIQEKPGKSVTKYTFQEPVRQEDFEKKQGRIVINYSQTTATEFATMAGLVMEKDPIVFECFQGNGNNQVQVKGYCSAKKESAVWIMPIFDQIWEKLLKEFRHNFE